MADVGLRVLLNGESDASVAGLLVAAAAVSDKTAWGAEVPWSAELPLGDCSLASWLELLRP